jgi:hypothetical protein
MSFFWPADASGVTLYKTMGDITATAADICYTFDLDGNEIITQLYLGWGGNGGDGGQLSRIQIYTNKGASPRRAPRPHRMLHLDP